MVLPTLKPDVWYRFTDLFLHRERKHRDRHQELLDSSAYKKWLDFPSVFLCRFVINDNEEMYNIQPMKAFRWAGTVNFYKQKYYMYQVIKACIQLSRIKEPQFQDWLTLRLTWKQYDHIISLLSEFHIHGDKYEESYFEFMDSQQYLRIVGFNT